MTPRRLLITGIPQPTHIGGHFLSASRTAPWQTTFLDYMAAFSGPRLLCSLWWRFGGHRPFRLKRYCATLVSKCAQVRPDTVITTGLAPIDAATLGKLRSMGIWTVNFLTDDPWNPQHHAPWFKQALPLYDAIFTPRRANMPELQALNGPLIRHLPFAYAPEIHHPPPVMTIDEQNQWRSDVLFIGGADADRSAIMRVFAGANINLSLWGGYWDRMPDLSPFARGHAGPEEFRKLVASAAVNLCLVRKANRDGHSMRTFELAATGGCMLVENTSEHRDLFGNDLERVAFFDDDSTMLAKARHLLSDPDLCRHLAAAVQTHITSGANTYGDRLATMMASRLPRP